MSFAGRHVVITGASTGIGAATASLLAERGARVTLVARSEAVLAATTREITAAGGKALGIAADVTDPSALARVFAEGTALNGPVDALFANAGMGGRFAPLPECSDSNWDAIIATNLTAVFRAMRHVLPGMIERRRGVILVTGSLASERGMANNPAYVASKHGVLGLARAAAIEGAAHGIRVNCLLPGLIETPLLRNIAPEGETERTIAKMARAVPQGRLGTAYEAAEAAVFLLSDAASHITGQTLAVDGGLLGTLSLERASADL